MSRRRILVWALLILTAATILRVRHAERRNSLWRDEVQDLTLVRESEDLLSALRHEGHPPLHYLLERAVGGGARHARTISILAGLLTVAVLMLWAGRLFGPRCGLVSGLLAATAPYFIYYATEIRVYALYGLLAVLHAAAFLRYLRVPRPAHAALWGAAAAVLCLTHYYGFFLVLAAGLYALWRDPRGWKRVAIAAGFATLVFLPWLPSFVAQMRENLQPWYAPRYEISRVFMTLGLPLGRGGRLLVLVALVFGALHLRREDRTAFGGLVALSLGGSVVAYIAQMVRGPHLPRYVIGHAYLLVPLVAYGGAVLLRHRRGLGFAALVLAVFLQYHDGTWRREVSAAAPIARLVEEGEQPGDLVWISPAFFSPSFCYHYRGRLPVLAPPYHGRTLHVDWIEILEREQDPDLLAEFYDQLENHLAGGGRVWFVMDNYFPLKDDFVFQGARSPGNIPPLVRYEYQIHVRVLRLLYTMAGEVKRFEGRSRDYRENMNLILFDPAAKQ